jgi:hypothetical protein
MGSFGLSLYILNFERFLFKVIVVFNVHPFYLLFISSKPLAKTGDEAYLRFNLIVQVFVVL